MAKILFCFVKQAASLAQKRCAASPTAVVSDPAGNGFAGWKHLTLHFLRIHMDASYAEIVDWASEMDRVRAVLQLTRTEFPAPSTLWRSFERVPARVWRQLLRRSAAICDPGEHGAWMPHSSTVRRHPATIDTARIATYARSKRRRWSIQNRVLPLISTVRHTGPTTHRWAVGLPCETPRNPTVSPVTKATTINRCGTPSEQRASGR